MSQLFAGKKLMRKHGSDFKEAAGDELNGKVVALYFSAHWCPPCRMFTPVLKDFYDEVEGEGFEVVFVSFDKTESDQHEYLKEAHGDWLFLKLADSFIKTLSEQYGVSGIPALIVIKPDGTAVNKNARTDVQSKTKAPEQVVKEWKTACGL